MQCRTKREKTDALTGVILQEQTIWRVKPNPEIASALAGCARVKERTSNPYFLSGMVKGGKQHTPASKNCLPCRTLTMLTGSGVGRLNTCALKMTAGSVKRLFSFVCCTTNTNIPHAFYSHLPQENLQCRFLIG